MYIKKIIIENFKCFEGVFSLELKNGLNILVGDNETGKSTILEAIHLALSGWFHGKYLKTELTQSLFNFKVVEDYLNSLQTDTPQPPPYIMIELFFESEDDSMKALFEGDGNSLKKSKVSGIQFNISLNEDFHGEYEQLVNEAKKDGETLSSLPIEYYDFSWTSFAREKKTPRTINQHFKSALIDSSSTHYRNGSDIYISRIVRDLLSEEHKVQISQAHRKMKDDFMNSQTIKDVNEKINEDSISDKTIELSVDVSTKSAWETSLVTYLDKIPFHFVGKGEQCLIKTKLALNHKKTKEANVLLLEEPENHLSHSKLNKLIHHIKENHEAKQIIISTHSSFVANKLGLGSLILLNADKTTNKREEIRIKDLGEETRGYFEKLAGYDTLRLLLCEKAILVEGDSDELVVQKAYRKNNDDRLPIYDEVDVISVGTSFLRFLEIAEKIKKPVVVVTDNDGDVEALKIKYENYLGENAKEHIKLCFDETLDSGDFEISSKPFNYNTLEPKFLKVNGLETLNKILGKTYTEINDMHKYMQKNKTTCALKIFETDEDICFPQYIRDAIS